MNCLVTGATGFIGRTLCRHLAAEGDTCLAFSRTGRPLADGRPSRALDLSTSGVGSAAMADVDVVYHLAGIAHQRADQRQYDELNTQATLQLAEEAATAGVRCFVFLSSVKAMGTAPDTRPRTEQDCRPAADAYGRSKWQAETALRAKYADSPMSVVILRSALVYGPGAKGNLAMLARAVRAGIPAPPALGGRSMVSTEDLAALMLLLGRRAPDGVNTWIVTDGERYSTREVYAALCAAAGREMPSDWMPVWMWRLAAALMDLRTEVGVRPSFDKWFGTDLYSNAALLEATGWRPGLTFGDVMTSNFSQ